MSKVDCSLPKNKELPMCLCKKAVDTMSKNQEDYVKKMAKYNSDMEAYGEWVKRHNEWKNQIGEFKYLNDKYNSIKDEVRYPKCEHVSATAGRTDIWCRNQIGDGWEKIGTSNQGCFLANKVKCRRSIEQARKEFNQYKNTKEPTKDSKGVTWKGRKPVLPDVPPSNNILCCSILFDDIDTNGGDLDIFDINQKCSQKIETTVLKSSTDTDADSDTDTKDVIELDSGDVIEEEEGPYVLPWIIGIIATMLLISSSFAMMAVAI